MARIIYPINGKTYTAEDVEIFNSPRTSGIYSVLDFDCSLSGNVLTIGKGLAWIKNGDFTGKCVAFTEPETLTLDSADSTKNRFDVVAIRYDASKTEPELVIIKGEPADIPSPPERKKETYLYELFLYAILRKAGEGSASFENLSDLRESETFCGIMRDSVTSSAASLYETLYDDETGMSLFDGHPIPVETDKYVSYVATVKNSDMAVEIPLYVFDGTSFGKKINGKRVISTSGGSETTFLITFECFPENISIVDIFWSSDTGNGQAILTKLVGIAKQPEGYVKVDDIYNPESHNAQSGEAVKQAIEQSQSVQVLNFSDFVNGSFEAGTGIVASDYWIITSSSIPVKTGDKIIIKPNGFAVWWKILNSNDLSIAKNLKNGGTTTEDVEYISEYDGWFNVQIKKTDGEKITPTDYVSNITIGASLKTQIADIKSSVIELKEDVKELKEGNTLSPSSTIISTSPKTKPFTNIINDCQTASDWTITNNDTNLVSVDTTNFILGSQSLRCDKQMQCAKHTYDLLNNDLVIKFRINSITRGASLDLRIGHKTGGSLLVYTLAKDSAWTTSSDWQEIVIPYTAYSYGNTELDFTSIDNIYIMSSGGSVDWNLQYIGLRPKKLKKGIVTFTFDDGYKSQYTGIKLLAEKGITGTIFHIKEATDNASAQALTITELQELVNYYGADIEVHGDPSYDQWEEDELAGHWANSQKWLKENGLGEGKHLAYPNGIFPDNVVQLAKGYFESCRTITPFIPLETYSPADRYRLRAVSSVGAYNVTVDKVKEYIDRANAAGAWLILVFHKIGDGTDSMWCSEVDLKAIADYAISSGAHIMNYAEVFDSVISAN